MERIEPKPLWVSLRWREGERERERERELLKVNVCNMNHLLLTFHILVDEETLARQGLYFDSSRGRGLGLWLLVRVSNH